MELTLLIKFSTPLR